MEKKIANARSVRRIDVYEKVDEELIVFGDIVETIKFQAKDVLIKELKLLQERQQRLHQGLGLFDASG